MINEINFRSHLWISAPMVRASVLPFRLACIDYGADLVYSEEIVASRILNSDRIFNPDFNTIEYRSTKDSGLVFSTNDQDKQYVIFQLGTPDSTTAIEAVKKIINDVRGVDVNMGCPKSFSVKNGMGAALLKKPKVAGEILRGLREAMPRNKILTCKIRLLNTSEETLAFAKMCESCGIDALIVHARKVTDRPSHIAQWDQFRALRSELTIPIIANGDLVSPQSITTFCGTYYSVVDSLMIARGCLWNPSLFRFKQTVINSIQESQQNIDIIIHSCNQFELTDPIECVQKILRYALLCGNIFQSMKWLALEMLNRISDVSLREKVQSSKTTMQLMKAFDLDIEYRNLLQQHPNWNEDVHTKFYFRNKRQFKLTSQQLDSELDEENRSISQQRNDVKEQSLDKKNSSPRILQNDSVSYCTSPLQNFSLLSPSSDKNHLHSPSIVALPVPVPISSISENISISCSYKDLSASNTLNSASNVQNLHTDTIGTNKRNSTTELPLPNPKNFRCAPSF